MRRAQSASSAPVAPAGAGPSSPPFSSGATGTGVPSTSASAVETVASQPPSGGLPSELAQAAGGSRRVAATAPGSAANAASRARSSARSASTFSAASPAARCAGSSGWAEASSERTRVATPRSSASPGPRSGRVAPAAPASSSTRASSRAWSAPETSSAVVSAPKPSSVRAEGEGLLGAALASQRPGHAADSRRDRARRPPTLRRAGRGPTARRGLQPLPRRRGPRQDRGDSVGDGAAAVGRAQHVEAVRHVSPRPSVSADSPARIALPPTSWCTLSASSRSLDRVEGIHRVGDLGTRLRGRRSQPARGRAPALSRPRRCVRRSPRCFAATRPGRPRPPARGRPWAG